MQAANYCQAYFIIAEDPSRKEIHTWAPINTKWRGCEEMQQQEVDNEMWSSLSCKRTPCLCDCSPRVSFSTRMCTFDVLLIHIKENRQLTLSFQHTSFQKEGKGMWPFMVYIFSSLGLASHSSPLSQPHPEQAVSSSEPKCPGGQKRDKSKTLISETPGSQVAPQVGTGFLSQKR